MVRRRTFLDEHLNQVVWFGGLPIRRGDMIVYLGEQAKELDKDNWLRLRDAGMLGNYQFNERHGYPPEGTDPLTLADFRMIVGATDDNALELKPGRNSKSKKAKAKSKRRMANPTSVRGIRR